MDTLHLTQAGGSCLCWRVANISIKNTIDIEKDRNVFVSIHPKLRAPPPPHSSNHGVADRGV